MAPQTRDADETEPGQAAADRVREDLQAALDRYDIETAKALDGHEEDRESSVSVTNVYVDRSDPGKIKVQREPFVTEPPKRKRPETIPPTSLRVHASDGTIVRTVKLALGSMHRHQRGWFFFAIGIAATIVISILVLEGRVKALSDYVAPPSPRESTPWPDERHERRRRRAEPVPTVAQEPVTE